MDIVDETGTNPQVAASPTRIVPAHGGSIVPFVKGDPRAIAAGRKSADARRARAGVKVGEPAAMRAALDEVCSTFQRGALGEQAAAVAGLMLARIASGAVKVPGSDYPALLRVLVDIARIEAGEATSAALVAHVSSADARARLAELQAQARAAIEAGAIEAPSAAAKAAADSGDSPSCDEGPTSDGGRYPAT